MDKTMTFNDCDFLDYMSNEISEKFHFMRLKTANNYISSYRSFKNYLHDIEGIDNIRFSELTFDILRRYEMYLLHKRRITRNTSSFYLRTLRAVYNKGVAEYNLNLPSPFKSLYMGVDHTRKRAVDIDVVIALMNKKLNDYNMELYRDVFVFSFMARGMSFIDLVKLKWSNVSEGRLIYHRSKTGQLLSVKLEPVMRKIISKYSDSAGQYLFPIMKPDNFDYNLYDRALHSYNYHLRKLSKELELDIALSSYVARHSWATEAMRMNIPTRVISESMGHSNERVTNIYLASLDYNEIDKANYKLLKKISTILREVKE